MGTYRVEVSPNNRATCRNAGCLENGVKITKGELRIATMVTIKDHMSWQYRHWNCFTPKQWLNVKEVVDENGGDLDYLDGYDELPADMQDLIRQCLDEGKVPDDQWRHDITLNRIGGRRKATPKKKKAEAGEEPEASGDDVDATPSKAKASKVKAVKTTDDEAEAKPKKKRVTKKRKADTESPEPEITTEEPLSPVPVKKARGKRVKKAKESSPAPPAAAPPGRKSRARTQKSKAAVKNEEEEVDAVAVEQEPELQAEDNDEAEDPKPKKRGGRKAGATAKPRGRKAKAAAASEED